MGGVFRLGVIGDSLCRIFRQRGNASALRQRLHTILWIHMYAGKRHESRLLAARIQVGEQPDPEDTGQRCAKERAAQKQ